LHSVVRELVIFSTHFLYPLPLMTSGAPGGARALIFTSTVAK